VHGRFSIRHDTIHTDGLHARAGPGTLRLSGRAGLTGGHALDLQLQADSAQVIDTDSASIITSAALNITGSASQPQVNGRLRLVGAWAKEDLMRSRTVIDPEHPPYARLAARAPWLHDSRLLPVRPTPLQAPPVHGQITIQVTPGLRVIDEDSELRGMGTVQLSADSTGVTLSGGIQFLAGFFVNFGERFLVVGGGHRFSPREPARLALRTENDVDKLGATDRGAGSPLSWYPATEIFITGTAAQATQQLRRNVPLPEDQAELAERLLFGTPVEPIAGWSNPRFWLPDQLSDLAGKRAAQQGGTLLWDYAADESYDYLPVDRATLFGGTITIGSRYPGRIVQGPLFRLAVQMRSRITATASLSTEGSAPPGLRLQWRNGAWSLNAFSEPKYYAAPPAGEGNPGFVERRRTGVGVRWERDF
jgi:hypothetical protein